MCMCMSVCLCVCVRACEKARFQPVILYAADTDTDTDTGTGTDTDTDTDIDRAVEGKRVREMVSRDLILAPLAQSLSLYLLHA
jgi:hypothetical protein